MPGTDTLDAGLGKQTASGVILMYLNLWNPIGTHSRPSTRGLHLPPEYRSLEKEAQEMDPEGGFLSGGTGGILWKTFKVEQGPR